MSCRINKKVSNYSKNLSTNLKRKVVCRLQRSQTVYKTSISFSREHHKTVKLGARLCNYHNDDVFLWVVMKILNNVREVWVGAIFVIRPVKMLVHVVNVTPLNLLQYSTATRWSIIWNSATGKNNHCIPYKNPFFIIFVEDLTNIAS